MPRVSADLDSPSDPAERAERSLRAEIWALLLLAGALCLFLALVSFSPLDAAVAGPSNLIGPAGAEIADATLSAIGLCAFFLDAVAFFCGFTLLVGRRPRLSWLEGLGYGLAIPAGAVFLHLVTDGQRVLGHKAGGIVGELGAEIGRSLLGSVGTGICTATAIILAIAMISETNPSTLAVRGLVLLRRSVRRLLAQFLALLQRGARRVAQRLVQRRDRRDAQAEADAGGDGPAIFDGGLAAHGEDEPSLDAMEAPSTGGRAAPGLGAGKPEPALPRTLPAPPPPRVTVRRAPPSPRPRSQIDLELSPREIRGFRLPGTTLLTAPATAQRHIDHEALRATARRLETALEEFKIRGQVTGITPGPVVTMFEFEPASGIKQAAIANVAADLARVIRAESVRIVAPIPGKSVVGLEVPNDEREIVRLREILEDPAFGQSHAKLPLALGKDISGRPVVTDLARMPHLLVAGATGSGKSVSVNTMVMSLLYYASPEDVRLIMVDPKMLELSIYEGIPHLLVPVVTDPQKAAVALKWAVNEMERRYHLLSEIKVRNIGGYNKAIEQIIEGGHGTLPPSLPVRPDGTPIVERMPHIVIVIDEFADLMMVASKDVETCVTRLAQKARAAGVHLILATQRPSVDVITGLIKANFPTRISFRVFGQVDSRTILDCKGAEALLGNGDMLFRAPMRGDLQRVHGAFVDEKEILGVVEFLKEQGTPDYREEILVEEGPEDFELAPDEVDDMYDIAVELVTRERKASISMVQRKLRVGYNRAARMVEMMEREGLVGPSDGKGQREVLAPPPPPD
jgi:S-DNA-T family DNA segregation ATPase FtsK/SpoIIIE